VRALYDRYTADGLVVVGIHSPEFDFEKIPSNVDAAVKHYDVTWPVALDSKMTIWNSFNNQYWPADYIADRSGNLRYSHFGEGDYANTENVIRRLLGLPANAPRAPQPTRAQTASQATQNPETYLDTQHGDVDVSPGVHDYASPGALPVPQVALGGKWNGESEKVVSAEAGASISLGMDAQQVNLVMAPQKGGQPIEVVVSVDGQPVPADIRGADLHVDPQGQTVVDVTHSDMYQLINAPGVQMHQVTVTAITPGLEAYDFTFG
jgi:hypothetical protein